MVSLTKIVNGAENVTLPQPLPGMSPVHEQLFNHAVDSLQEYQAQPLKEKDVTLIKDAHVAMSCVLNIMSDRACTYFEQSTQGENLVGRARSTSVIPGFEEHPSSVYARKYLDTLEKNGARYLRKKLAIDRGDRTFQAKKGCDDACVDENGEGVGVVVTMSDKGVGVVAKAMRVWGWWQKEERNGKQSRRESVGAMLNTMEARKKKNGEGGTAKRCGKSERGSSERDCVMAK